MMIFLVLEESCIREAQENTDRVIEETCVAAVVLGLKWQLDIKKTKHSSHVLIYKLHPCSNSIAIALRTNDSSKVSGGD